MATQKTMLQDLAKSHPANINQVLSQPSKTPTQVSTNHHETLPRSPDTPYGFEVNMREIILCGQKVTIYDSDDERPPPGSGVEETKDGSTEPPPTTAHPTTQDTDLLNLADLAVEDSASSTPQTTSSAITKPDWLIKMEAQMTPKEVPIPEFEFNTKQVDFDAEQLFRHLSPSEEPAERDHMSGKYKHVQKPTKLKTRIQPSPDRAKHMVQALPASSENVPQVASAPTTQTISRGASDTSSDKELPLKAPPPVLKTPTTVLKTALKQPPPPSPTSTQAPDSEGFQTQQPRRRVQAKTKQKQNKKKTKTSKKSGGALQPICSIISPSRYAKDSSSSSGNSPNVFRVMDIIEQIG